MCTLVCGKADVISDLPKPKKLIASIMVTLLLALPAHAQQTDELQKQLQQLEQQYEQTTKDLRDRITALEQQIAKKQETTQDESQKARTVSAAELAAEAARNALLGDLNENGKAL